jgi:hypothetical protein
MRSPKTYPATSAQRESGALTRERVPSARAITVPQEQMETLAVRARKRAPDARRERTRRTRLLTTVTTTSIVHSARLGIVAWPRIAAYILRCQGRFASRAPQERLLKTPDLPRACDAQGAFSSPAQLKRIAHRSGWARSLWGTSSKCRAETIRWRVEWSQWRCLLDISLMGSISEHAPGVLGLTSQIPIPRVLPVRRARPHSVVCTAASALLFYFL